MVGWARMPEHNQPARGLPVTSWRGALTFLASKRTLFDYQHDSPVIIRQHPSRERLAKLTAAFGGGTIHRYPGPTGEKMPTWIIAGRYAAELMFLLRPQVSPEQKRAISAATARSIAAGHFACVDCKKNVLPGSDEYNKLHDEIWASIAPIVGCSAAGAVSAG
jgi:hypothetical protein